MQRDHHFSCFTPKWHEKTWKSWCSWISFYHLVFQKKLCLNIVCNRLTDNDDQFKKYGTGLTDMQAGLASPMGDCTQLILQKMDANSIGLHGQSN